MKINKVITEVMKGSWFINVNALDNYLPLVDAFLNSKITMPQGELDPLMKEYNSDGSSADGQQEVKEKIAVVSMIGPIMKYGACCSYGAEDIVESLERAESDPKVKGTIFYIDGPGGSTAAIAPFLAFAEKKTKPIVVLADSAYSLHYWTACAVGDHIMADNKVNSGFGSVGVMVSFMDAKGHYEAKGYKLHEVYSSHSEHKNESFQLALEGKYDMIKTEMLDPLALKFQNAVKAARGSKLKTEVPGILSGKTFYAEEALQHGMIDSIGNFKNAIEVVNMLVELKN